MRRNRFFFLVFLCFALLLTACGRAKADREGQFSLPFAASIAGTRGELAFAAEITATAEACTIRYTAPEALAGLTVARTSGGVSIWLGEFELKDQPDAEGLLAPLDLLLSPAELAAVEEQNGEKILTYTDGAKLILQKDGTPRAAAGNDLFFTVLEFESRP